MGVLASPRVACRGCVTLLRTAERIRFRVDDTLRRPIRRPDLRNPRDLFKHLAIGAAQQARGIPVKPSRMIHFLDFSNEKMVAKVPDIAPAVDILLGNLEDAIPLEKKEAAQ